MNVHACFEHKVPSVKFDMHCHDEWEFIYLLKGSTTYTIDGIKYHVNEGNICVIPPHIMHSGVADDIFVDMYLKAYDLDFNGVLLVQDYDLSIKQLMLLIAKVITEKEYNYTNIADGLLETIVQYVKKYAANTYKYEFISTLKNKIFENFTDSHYSVANDIASLGYNNNYVRRCFKEELGCTPLNYLTKLRIEQAKKLLYKQPNKKIDEVAVRCGFNDCFYFSRVFKKYTGMSPREFKKE